MGNVEKVKKIGGIVLNVIVWIILVISVITTILVFSAQGSEDGIPSVFGKSLVTIETESMEPTFGKGSLVIMTKLDTYEEKAELEVGDIITFFAPIDINGDGKTGDINTHRIESFVPGKYEVITKGDNNLVNDNTGSQAYTVHYGDIIGVCSEDSVIPGVGAVIAFLRSSLGFFLCIVLPLILFFLYELYRFIALLVSERAKKVKTEVSRETEEEIKRRAIEEYLKSINENKNNDEDNNASN